MPLKRISDQKSQTIQEFYVEVIEEQKVSAWNDSGETMLNLVKKLDELFPGDVIWCLTSLYRLVLLTKDDWKSPWYVLISSLNSKEIYVEYRMPDGSNPWEDATVKGVANSLDKAVDYILIAMQKSEGWKSMKSLESLIIDRLS